MSFHVPEKWRVTKHSIEALVTSAEDGNCGCFRIILKPGVGAWCIASDDLGWEHVSVHIGEKRKGRPLLQRIPTWEEMCMVKDLFWDAEDCVIQFHPPKSLYVNMHDFTLHLWKQTGVEITIPHPILVGIPDQVNTES